MCKTVKNIFDYLLPLLLFFQLLSVRDYMVTLYVLAIQI